MVISRKGVNVTQVVSQVEKFKKHKREKYKEFSLAVKQILETKIDKDKKIRKIVAAAKDIEMMVVVNVVLPRKEI